MGDAVGAQPRELLDRPALAASEEPRRDAEHGLGLGGSLGVGGVLQLDPLEGGGVGRAGGDRGRQVDDPHRASSVVLMEDRPTALETERAIFGSR